MKSVPTATAPDPDIRGLGETILLIEDDQNMRVPLMKGLGTFNYQVFAAATVEEALTLWSEHRNEIHAVVSDCNLGDSRTGLSLLHEFSQGKPSLVMILASGSLTPTLTRELERTTTIKCLPKPYPFLKVLELLREGLDNRPVNQRTITASA